MQTIGDLAKPITDEASGRGSAAPKSSTLPRGSATMPPSADQNTKTSTALSRTGSPAGLATKTLESAASPWEANRAIRSLTSQWTWLAEYGSLTNDTPIRYRFKGDGETARQAMTTLMRPADSDVLARELVNLAAVTKRRADSPSDTKLMIAAYLDLLSDVPADLALWALRMWPKQKTDAAKWFPAWAELRGLIDDALTDRRRMMDAIE